MSSKTTHYCDFCGAETDFDKMTSIKGDIWFYRRSQQGDRRKTIVDCSSEIIDLCPGCREKAEQQMQPFIHFITTKGDAIVYEPDSESEREQANLNDD